MNKIVPLVIYKGEERIVIGEASLVLGSGTDIVVSARIDPVHAGILTTPNVDMSIREETFDYRPAPSISERLAKDYGYPQASSDSIKAWADVVEQFSEKDSNLDKG